MCLTESTREIWIKIDSHYQRQWCFFLSVAAIEPEGKNRVFFSSHNDMTIRRFLPKEFLWIFHTSFVSQQEWCNWGLSGHYFCSKNSSHHNCQFTQNFSTKMIHNFIFIILHAYLTFNHNFKNKLECVAMPSLMAARLLIWSKRQSYLSPVVDHSTRVPQWADAGIGANVCSRAHWLLTALLTCLQ